MRSWSAVALLAIGSVACQQPSEPSRLTPTTLSAPTPATILLPAKPGVGTSAMQAFVTATVRADDGRNVPDVTVTFSASSGTLSKTTVVTDGAGQASTTLTSPQAATITAAAGSVSRSVDVALDPQLRVTMSVSPPLTGEPAFFAASVLDAVDPVTYRWTFGDGETATTTKPEASHAYARSGDVTVSVLVTDGRGLTGSALELFRVTDPPPPPPATPPPAPGYTVSVTATPSSVVVNGSALLTATATPINGAPPVASYEFDCDGNGTPESTGALNTALCTYPTVGTTTSRVTAKGAAAAGVGSVIVTVMAAAPLFVNITASPIVAGVVTFTATLTSVGPLPPGSLWWQWDDINDGTYEVIVVGPNPNSRTTTYGSSGKKTVKVFVTDPATTRTTSSTLEITVP